jgi:hypothetical protein
MADKKAKGAVVNPAVTKAEAVRRALTELGHDASAAAIQKYVNDKFGHVMTTDHVYNTKSEALKQLRKKAGSKASEPKAKAAAPKPAAKPAAKPATAVPAPSVAAKSPSASPGVSLADIAAVKSLIGRMGAAQLHGLIDLLEG